MIDPTKKGVQRRFCRVGAHPAQGTPVETYLASLGIDLPPPDVLRFHGGLKLLDAIAALRGDTNATPAAIPACERRVEYGLIKGRTISMNLFLDRVVATTRLTSLPQYGVSSAANAYPFRRKNIPAAVRPVRLLPCLKP
jgi:hypothetical protein